MRWWSRVKGSKTPVFSGKGMSAMVGRLRPQIDTPLQGIALTGAKGNFASLNQQAATPFRLVRTGQTFSSLQAAHDAGIDGDTVAVSYSPTTYVLPASGIGVSPICTFTKTFTVTWEIPGLVSKFDVSAFWQQADQFGNADATLDMGPSCTNLTIRGMDITGFQVPNTGRVAGLNIESGYPNPYPNSVPFTCLVEFCAFRKFTNGVLTGHNEHGVLTLRNSLIEDCMAGDGVSHGIYVSAIEHLHLEGMTFRTTPALGFIENAGYPGDPKYGHLAKSRARSTTVTASVFDGRYGCARCLETPNGGSLSITGSFFHKYTNPIDLSPNQTLAFGAEQRLNPGQTDPTSGFPNSFDNTGFTLTFCHDGRVHSIFLAQNTIENEAAQNLLLVYAIPDDSKNIITIPQTVRNNVAAGSFSSDITSFANNVAVTTVQISASGALNIAAISGTQNDATTEYVRELQAPITRTDSNKGAFQNGLPVWMPATAFAWADVPSSTPSLYLKNDGSGVLPAAFSAGGGNQESNYRQCNSYGCAGWSEKNKEFWLFGGGHLATNMNPLVKARLNQAAPDWVAVDAGSTSLRIQSDYDGGSWDGSAYQTDGRPKSTHTYRGNNYLDSIDEFVEVGGAATNSTPTGPGHGEYSDCYGWPRSGSAWRAQNYWPQVPNGGTITDSGQCPDPNGNGVYVIRSGNPLWRLDAATRTWSTIGGGVFHNWIGGQAPEAHKMGANLAGQILAITIIGDFTAGVPYSIRYISTTTGVETPITMSGDSFPVFISTGMRPANVVYAEANGKWYVTFCTDDGNFGSNPQPLYSITPTGANTATVALVSTTGNAPTGGLRGGLYYSKDWKCLLVYNGWGKPIQALRVV